MTTQEQAGDQAGTGAGAADAALLGFKPAAGAAEGNPAGAGGEPGSQAPAGEGRYVDYAGARLEVPEQFWDAKAGAPNIGALLKSQTDLRQQLSNQPKAPETYELKVPEPLAGKVELKPDDPFAKKAMDWAKARNLPQDAFDELSAMYLEHQAGTWEADDKAIVAEIEADIGKLQQQLGKDAGIKVAGLDKWLAEIVGKDEGQINAVRNLRATADGTLFLMALRDRMGEPQIPGGAGTGTGAAPTREELRKMMDDPRYWKDKDPAFIKRVDEAYAKHFPG